MKKYFLYLLLLFFISCTNKDVLRESVRVLSVSTATENYVLLSDVVTESLLVSLETNDHVLIRDIAKVDIVGEFIYISDNKTLYQFELSGAFVNKLDKAGGGPEEYLQISDFQVDTSGIVWVLSRDSKRIYKYNSSFEFDKSISLKYWLNAIKLLDMDTMILYLGNETNAENLNQIKYLSLSTGEVINSFLEIDLNKAEYLHVSSANYFSSINNENELYFFQIFNDTIYRLTQLGVYPEYVVDIDKKNIPERFFKTRYDNIMLFFQELFKNSYAYGTNFFLESDGVFYYSYYFEKERYMALVSKEENKSLLVFKEIRENINLCDYPIKLNDIEMFIQSDNRVVIPIDPYYIMEYVDENLSAKQKKELCDKYSIVSEDQNPLLLILNFK